MIAVVFVTLATFAVCYYILALICLRAFFSRKHTFPEWTPPVSILKPVKELDAGAYENFLSFLRQDYPDYEVLFGVESEEDPAVPIIKRLLQSFPERAAHLIVAGPVSAINRKVGIMAVLARHARHDVLVISDSDVRVRSNYLKTVVGPFRDSEVGMVTCLYKAQGAANVPARLESLMIHLDFLPAVLIAACLQGRRFGFGATMAIQRRALTAIGGFESLSDYLADDYLLGCRICEAGYRVELSTLMVNIVLKKMNPTEFFQHQLRWARTYKVCRPYGYFASILTHGVFFSLVYVFISGFSFVSWIILFATGSVRSFMAAFILARYLKQESLLRFLLLVPLKEILSVALWLLAFLGNRVTWKDRIFELTAGGRMVLLRAPRN